MACYDSCCQEMPEPVTVLSTIRTSRKERVCATCGGQIKPGEKYLRRFLPPDSDHDESLTVVEHVSAGICHVEIMYQEAR